MTLFALLLGLIAIRKKRNHSAPDILLGYLFFLAVGLAGIWGFIFHAFFPEMSAKFIGWANSPFQFEVAVANLGMGLVGIFGLRAKKSYRIAGTLLTTCFLWGAAYGHVVQMSKMHNFAPGNAGPIFYNDIIMPLLLIIFLLLWRERGKL
jgi:hypothetical protein